MRIIFYLVFSFSFVLSQQQVFVLCEGNFLAGNATLWTIDMDSGMLEYPHNPVGDTGQSLCIDGDRLYAVMNGSSSVEIFDIQPTGGLTHSGSINMDFNSPRHMVILDGVGYVSRWYSQDIAVVDLENQITAGSIPVTGLPEHIVTDGSLLYVSIVLTADWIDASEVLSIDPVSGQIVNTYSVGPGPGQMLLKDSSLYVARTFYDEEYNAYSGMSLINLLTNDIISADYGSETSWAADLAVLNDMVYRTYNGGIVPVTPSLELMLDAQIGNYAGINSMAISGGNIYLGLSDDYLAPDQIVMLNAEGEELALYQTGAIPGSMVFWPENTSWECEPNGDVNQDNGLDILDIVVILNYILNSSDLSEGQLCNADVNQDGMLDILDIIGWVDIILE